MQKVLRQATYLLFSSITGTSSIFAYPLAANTFEYIGQPANNTSLLTLGGYRHYNPTQGAFLKQDSYSPFATNRTFNGFNYSAGNPVMLVDFSGHLPITFIEMDIMPELNQSLDSLINMLFQNNAETEVSRYSKLYSMVIEEKAPEIVPYVRPLRTILRDSENRFNAQQKILSINKISELTRWHNTLTRSAWFNPTILKGISAKSVGYAEGLTSRITLEQIQQYRCRIARFRMSELSDTYTTAFTSGRSDLNTMMRESSRRASLPTQEPGGV